MFGFVLGYVKNDQPMKALSLFHDIRHPDEVILAILFNACAKIQSSEAREIINRAWSNMPRSYRDNPILITSLIDALMKCADVPSAEICFSQTKSKNLKMYGAMMKGNRTATSAGVSSHSFVSLQDTSRTIYQRKPSMLFIQSEVLMMFSSCFSSMPVRNSQMMKH